jgi:hypothetical protein
MLAKMGIAPDAVPIRPALDFGIKIPPRTPKPPKAITPEEANEMFGVSLAVKMNFIPQMIIAVALDQTTQFVNYCRDNRIQEFKKHNRLIKLCVEEYTGRLRQSYGTAFQAYVNYVDRYFKYVEVDRFKMWCSIGNVVNKQLSRDKDRDGATHIAIIHNLINYAEKYDRQMDKVIADKVKAPVSRKQDDMLKLIVAMCIEFEETWGFKLEPDPMVDANIGVLSNRAAFLADAIIGEESNVSKS